MTTPQEASRGPRLLDQVRDEIRLRHYSLRTEHTYVGWIKRFILFHNKRHLGEMGAEEITRYLTHLAVNGRVSVCLDAKPGVECHSVSVSADSEGRASLAGRDTKGKEADPAARGNVAR